MIGDRTWLRDEAGESGAAVFRLTGAGGDLYLKHGSYTFAQAVIDEAVRLRWLRGRIPSAPIVAFAAQGDEAWLLTRAVRGRSGDGWLARDATLLPRIIDAFAGFLVRLHALDASSCPFRADAEVRLAAARQRVVTGAVDEEDFDTDHAGWTAAEVLAEVEGWAPYVRSGVVTHGDFSLGNLILDGAMRVTGCIDADRLGVADPYQDIAILWQNLAEHGVAAQRRFLDAIGIVEPDPARLAFHRCLDELF